MSSLNSKTMKTHGYAPVNGLKMYYEIEGTGDPLVYIPPAFGFAGLKSFPALTASSAPAFSAKTIMICAHSFAKAQAMMTSSTTSAPWSWKKKKAIASTHPTLRNLPAPWFLSAADPL